MMTSLNTWLMGATAMASFVAAMFFFRFWQQTRDRFFALFAVAFASDAITRLVLGAASPSSDAEPFAYAARLLTYALILLAIIDKNRPRRS